MPCALVLPVRALGCKRQACERQHLLKNSMFLVDAACILGYTRTVGHVVFPAAGKTLTRTSLPNLCSRSLAMRVSLTLGMLLFALAAVAPVSAQAKKEKEKASTAPTSRAVLSSLQVEIGSTDFANLMKFSELLHLSRE